MAQLGLRVAAHNLGHHRAREPLALLLVRRLQLICRKGGKGERGKGGKKEGKERRVRDCERRGT